MPHLHYHDANVATEMTTDKWWALRNIHVLQAWHIAKQKGHGETILLVGESCSPHAELEGDALLNPSQNANRFDGTCMATIAVSRQIGEIAGSAPAAQILAMPKFEDAVASVLNGAGIVATTQPIPSSLAQTMKKEGAIVLAPAGDDGVILGKDSAAIMIAGSTHDDQFWEGSNKGAAIDFAAPACKVWGGSLSNETPVAPVSGTLAAVALIAGVAVLWRSHWGASTLNSLAQSRQTSVHDLFKRAVLDTVRCPNHWDEQTQGAGIIDAEALMQLPLDSLH